MNDDAEIELAARPDDPQARFNLRVARALGAQSVEKAFNVVLGYHRAPLLESKEDYEFGEETFQVLAKLGLQTR
jgi:hypothetical protein